MRRTIFWIGTLALGVATSIWVTAPLRAQHGARRGGPVRETHPIARIGSSIMARCRTRPSRPRRATGPGARGYLPQSVSRGVFEALSSWLSPNRAWRRAILHIRQSAGGCQTVLENGITYDVCDGVYYQPYIYGGRTVYWVVPT